MEEKLFEYAKLVVEVGLNVQKGQTVIISSPVECAHFCPPVQPTPPTTAAAGRWS